MTRFKKIQVTQVTTEYRATFLFGQAYWFPFALAIDWAEILHA